MIRYSSFNLVLIMLEKKLNRDKHQYLRWCNPNTLLFNIFTELILCYLLVKVLRSVFLGFIFYFCLSVFIYENSTRYNF